MERQILEELVLANRILSREKILDALGHISVRNPDNSETFLMACAKPPLLVTEEDIIEIDLEGRVVKGTDRKPVLERFLHSAIYKNRKDVNAVVHGHHPTVVVFSVTGIPLKPVTHTGSFIYEGVPVFDEYSPGSGTLIDNVREGEKVALCLGDKKALLMRGHGYIVVGESIRKAVASAIYMVVNAEVQWRSILCGREPKALSREEAQAASEKALFGESPLSRMWEYWRERVAETH